MQRRDFLRRTALLGVDGKGTTGFGLLAVYAAAQGFEGRLAGGVRGAGGRAQPTSRGEPANLRSSRAGCTNEASAVRWLLRFVCHSSG